MSSPSKSSSLVSGSLLAGMMIFGTLACRKPQAAQITEPKAVNTNPQVPAGQDEEALKKAEAARLKAEQDKLDAARRAEAEKLAAYQRAAENAIQDIHFDFDKSDIREVDKATLQGIANFMKTYPAAKIKIEGHCDERGTIEYNLALGQRRAVAVKTYLVALGVEDGRLSTISYGKEKPLCTESNENCWFRNRRGHSVLQ
jgi:peptidoglycan-associated lipoprotein